MVAFATGATCNASGGAVLTGARLEWAAAVATGFIVGVRWAATIRSVVGSAAAAMVWWVAGATSATIGLNGPNGFRRGSDGRGRRRLGCLQKGVAGVRDISHGAFGECLLVADTSLVSLDLA